MYMYKSIYVLILSGRAELDVVGGAEANKRGWRQGSGGALIQNRRAAAGPSPGHRIHFHGQVKPRLRADVDLVVVLLLAENSHEVGEGGAKWGCATWTGDGAGAAVAGEAVEEGGVGVAAGSGPHEPRQGKKMSTF